MNINDLIEQLCAFRHLHGNAPIALSGDGFNRLEPKLVFDAKLPGAALVPQQVKLTETSSKPRAA